MKYSFLIFALLALSTLVHADLAEDHQQKCNTPEIQELIGESGSCRVVVVPKKIVTNGSCTGTFMGSLPCNVTYHVLEIGSFINLTCGSDPLNPVISQEMPGEAIGYNLALVVKKSDGSTLVIRDSLNYHSISNSLISISVAESSIIQSPLKLAKITMLFQGREVEMSDISCSTF